MKIRIGTRGSALALWQAQHVVSLLGEERCDIVIIKTKGDRVQDLSFDKIEGKGFFTKEIEEHLIGGRIDVAVHSMKDLPVDDSPGLRIGAVLQRASASDILLVRSGYDAGRKTGIAPGSVVGTGSVRRSAQLAYADPTLQFRPLRGNVPTRIEKLRGGAFDAIVLASAGIERLMPELYGFTAVTLPYDVMLPAPAQGAIALQIRCADDDISAAVLALDHAPTRRAVSAERAFLSGFGGGCHIPLGAFAFEKEQTILLDGVILSPDGKKMIRKSVSGTDPEETGRELADILMSHGGSDL